MFISFLDSAAASFWVFGLLLFLLICAASAKALFGIGRLFLPAIPTVLWLLNGLWVKTGFLKGSYSFKIDLYLLYPTLTLVTLGVFGIYLVSVMRDLLAYLDERPVPEEEGLVLKIARGLFSPEFLSENLLMLGMVGSVLLLITVLIGVLSKQILLALAALLLVLLTCLVVAFLLRFIALKDQEGRDRLDILSDKLALCEEMVAELQPVLQEFDKILTTRMEALPKEAGEIYQRARLFCGALEERISKVEKLQAVGRIEEIEAALAVIDEPLSLAADIVNSLASPNIPRFVDRDDWKSFSEEHRDKLQSMVG